MDYDQVTARHYAAYRPPLHSLLLSACLKGRDKQTLGLDIGCGTGQSSIALTNYCNKVIGIDPSEDMLKRARQHADVKYRKYNGADLEFESDIFNIITFAGSLFYAKSQLLLDEVARVCRHDALVIVYDFEVVLTGVLAQLGVDPKLFVPGIYDHQVNFHGLDQHNFILVNTLREQTSFSLNAQNLGHLLLSSKDYYKVIKDALGANKLYLKTVSRLQRRINDQNLEVPVNLYSTLYTCTKA